MDPLSIRPMRNWLLVVAEPRKAHYGLLLVPNELTAEKLSSTCSVVVRVGEGEMNKALGLAPGQRVLVRDYLKHILPFESEETWPGGTKKTYYLVKAESLVAVVAEGVEVGALAERKD